MKSIEDKVCIGFIIFALMFIGWQTGRWFERSDIKQTIKARHNATIHYYVPQLGMHVFPFEKGFIQLEPSVRRFKYIYRKGESGHLFNTQERGGERPLPGLKGVE